VDYGQVFGVDVECLSLTYSFGGEPLNLMIVKFGLKKLETSFYGAV